MTNPIYYDHASTTPVDSRVKDAMLPYFDEIFGNASSNHIYGKGAKKAIDIAREQIAKLISANTKEIVFTSGATEAINSPGSRQARVRDRDRDEGFNADNTAAAPVDELDAAQTKMHFLMLYCLVLISQYSSI